jgi:hypothetical protein
LPLIFRFFVHQIRSAVQEEGFADIIRNLRDDEIAVIVDWMCKILEDSGEQNMSEWWARKGNSVLGSSAICRDPTSPNDYIISYFDLVFQDMITQDASMSFLAIKTVLSQIHDAFPHITSLTLSMDNGSGFHANKNVALLVALASLMNSLKIERLFFAECQDGKSLLLGLSRWCFCSVFHCSFAISPR